MNNFIHSPYSLKHHRFKGHNLPVAALKVFLFWSSRVSRCLKGSHSNLILYYCLEHTVNWICSWAICYYYCIYDKPVAQPAQPCGLTCQL